MSDSIEYKQEWKDEDAKVLEAIIAANGNLERCEAVRENNWRNLVLRFTDPGQEDRISESEYDETLYQKARVYKTIYNGQPIWIKAGWTNQQKNGIANSNNAWYAVAREEGHGDLHPSVLEGKYYTVMEHGGNNLFDLLAGTKDDAEISRFVGYFLDFLGVKNPHTEDWVKRAKPVKKNLLHTLRTLPSGESKENTTRDSVSRGEAQRAIKAFIQMDIDRIGMCKAAAENVGVSPENMNKLLAYESKLANIDVQDLCGPYCPTVLSFLDPRRNILLKEDRGVSEARPQIKIIDQPGYTYDIIHAPIPLHVGYLYKVMRAEEIPEAVAKYIYNRLTQEYIGTDETAPLNNLWASEDPEQRCNAKAIEELGATHFDILEFKTKFLDVKSKFENLTDLVK